MQENSPRQQSPSDEIDLGQVFKAIGNFFARIGNGILLGIANLRIIVVRNKILFILLVIIGLIGGYLYAKQVRKTYYQSFMLISSEYFNNQLVTNAIEKLNLLCLEQQRFGLARELGIEPEVARNIRRFGSEPFVSEEELVEVEVLRTQLKDLGGDKLDAATIQNVIERIQIENKSTFRIFVQVYNPNILGDLQQNLIAYFRENEYIKTRIEADSINLLERRKKLIRESSKLDSLKHIIYLNFESMAQRPERGGSSNLYLGDQYLTNPIDVFNSDLYLNEQLLEIDKKIKTKPYFEVVDGLTVFEEPESAPTWKVMLFSMLIFVFLGYFILGLLNFNRYLDGLSKKASST